MKGFMHYLAVALFADYAHQWEYLKVFYSWKVRVKNPSANELQRLYNIQLFISYHEACPSQGLKDLINKKEEYGNLKLILHTDQGFIYSSKAFNDLLPLYNITHSMSRAGTPTDNPAMVTINGW